MREYWGFFKKAAAAIWRVDSDVRVVMYPPCWGLDYALDNLRVLCDMGYAEIGGGIAYNVGCHLLRDRSHVADFVRDVRRINPSFELHANGVGYCVDRIPEREQAIRVFHTMFKLWDAGWDYAPYYLLSKIRHPWSPGLVVRDRKTRKLTKRPGWEAFRTCASVFCQRRKMRTPELSVRIRPTGEILRGRACTYELNGGRDEAQCFAYEWDGQLALVLMQSSFNSQRETVADVAIRSGKYGCPVRIPMLNFEGREDITYGVSVDKSIVLRGLRITSEPLIVRLVAHEALR